jgi:hypothetical protein
VTIEDELRELVKRQFELTPQETINSIVNRLRTQLESKGEKWTPQLEEAIRRHLLPLIKNSSTRSS